MQLHTATGSVYLLTKTYGFTGSIKNFTKDFVVTEIDIDGKPVSRSTLFADSEPHCSSQNNSKPKVERNVAPKSETAECKTDDSPPSPGSLDLGLILGETVSEKLEQFVARLKDGDGSVQELSLGSYSDKHQRANVHRAVKINFPFLMTTTSQCEIKVKESQDYKELAQLVTEAEADGFFRFIDAKVSGSSHTFLPDGNKEHRTAVHRFLSRRFGKLVETKSFTEQGKHVKTCISVRLRERGRVKKRTAEDCRQEEIYTAFTLCKENLETLEAISYMAAELGVLPSDFTYAGIKDKRAITYQSMVVKKVTPERLKEKAMDFERRGICLFAIRSVSEPLKLGQLRGNHFDIVIRDVKKDKNDPEPHLELAVKRAVGVFVNYYGPQRFGSAQSVQSDQIGLALLKGDLVSAVHVFFSPDVGDEPQNQAKRHFLETGNAKEALMMMPVSKARERLMLRALNRYGTGPHGCAQAWLSLPHSMRIFYLHAYCSRLWNEAAEHRLKTFGHNVIQGDLVQSVKCKEDDNDQAQIHVVTEQEVRDGIYVLEEVHLPMPGNTVKYPENTMATWYKERLARDGLENCRFRVSSLKMNVPGCYRPLLTHPRNLTFSLSWTDREEVEVPAVSTVSETGIKGREKTENNSKLNLALKFDLIPSSYATVFLREIMKCEVF
uniref:Pseudouridylate synthase PUS7L n=1 Tax=Neogobius melanostomus TaxID=47308 RepID=A0A8C6SPP9_9GOBI